MTEGIVEKIYAELKKCLEINENQSLENFRFELKASILQYIETVLNRNMTLDALVNSYFTKVQGDVCDYNSDMTDAIYRTLSALDDWKSSAGERLRKGEEQGKVSESSSISGNSRGSSTETIDGTNKSADRKNER